MDDNAGAIAPAGQSLSAVVRLAAYVACENASEVQGLCTAIAHGNAHPRREEFMRALAHEAHLAVAPETAG